MANQLREAKVLSIKTLHEQGWSQRRIARELGINRETVARYLKLESKPATFENAPTGSDPENPDSKPATVGKAPTGSRSLCEPFRELILHWLDQGLSAQRIYQDLDQDHGFAGGYTSVRRYVAKLKNNGRCCSRSAADDSTDVDLVIERCYFALWILLGTDELATRKNCFEVFDRSMYKQAGNQNAK